MALVDQRSVGASQPLPLGVLPFPPRTYPFSSLWFLPFSTAPLAFINKSLKAQLSAEMSGFSLFHRHPPRARHRGQDLCLLRGLGLARW